MRNNILAFAEEQQVQRTRTEEHLSFTFERNIVYWTQGDLLASNWSGNNYRLDHNLYWNADGSPPRFPAGDLEAWRKRGFDGHSRVADPRFAVWLQRLGLMKNSGAPERRAVLGVRSCDADFNQPDWAGVESVFERREESVLEK